MAGYAGIVRSAALMPDSDDVALGVIVSALGAASHIYAQNSLQFHALSRVWLYKNHLQWIFESFSPPTVVQIVSAMPGRMADAVQQLHQQYLSRVLLDICRELLIECKL